MRCFSRSIASFSNSVARQIGLVTLLVMASPIVEMNASVNSETDLRVEQAIVNAVRARLGEAAEVSVAIGQVRLIDGEYDELEARPTRFTLYQTSSNLSGGSVRVGYAVAEAHAVTEHVRTARPINRGTTLTDDDLVALDGDLGAVLMRPLPTHQSLVGAIASRDLRSGTLVTSTVVALPKLVRARESVVVRVQVGSVIASGHATATENGELGDVISLLNEQSGRRLRGRVVAPGEVEVVQ